MERLEFVCEFRADFIAQIRSKIEEYDKFLMRLISENASYDLVHIALHYRFAYITCRLRQDLHNYNFTYCVSLFICGLFSDICNSSGYIMPELEDDL
jgi:hypothetical protein